jgi:signal transduction protein with GAF and PtsI domain
MAPRDLLQQLAELVVDLDPVPLSEAIVDQLTAVCATVQAVFSSPAVSVATVADGSLHYVAASGVGADAIVGVELPLDRGIGGYVAATGQAIAVDRPADDPRWARDIAERTGVIPQSLLIVPVTDDHDDVIGIVTVIDRTIGSADALSIASAFAEQIAGLLVAGERGRRTASVVLDALLDSVRAGDAQLADGLQRAIPRLPGADAEIAATAAVLQRLRSADPATRGRALALIAEVVELATARRRR